MSANFWKNFKWSYWDTQGPEGNWFMKKTWSWKSRVRLPLKKIVRKKLSLTWGWAEVLSMACSNIEQVGLTRALNTSQWMKAFFIPINCDTHWGEWDLDFIERGRPKVSLKSKERPSQWYLNAWDSGCPPQCPFPTIYLTVWVRK